MGAKIVGGRRERMRAGSSECAERSAATKIFLVFSNPAAARTRLTAHFSAEFKFMGFVV